MTHQHLHTQSINIIRAGQTPGGAYLACASFSQYGYSWLRDGTWIAYAMASVGQTESAEAFYRWAARTLIAHTAKVDALLGKLAAGETPDESDYLPTRFTADGLIGTDAWTEFQLDGYGAWLWGLAQYCKSADHALWIEARPAVMLTIRYLAALWQSPNFDCWEEHRDQVHPATLAAIYGGLTAVRALEPALVPAGLPETIREFTLQNAVTEDGHFMKSLGNPEVDASLLWLAVPYRLVALDDPRFLATLAKIERDLVVPDGGVYRYRADTYYGGGEWILLAGFLAWTYLELNRVDDAKRLYQWMMAQATEAGELPEQVQGHLLSPEYYEPWVARWGTPACPLLWSHAMLLLIAGRF